MEYLFKKYLWVLHVALVALVGGYVGASVADYAGERLLDTQVFSAAGLDRRVSDLKADATKGAAGELASVDTLKSRYVFNVDRFLEDDEPLDAEGEGEGEGEDEALDVGEGDGFADADVNAQLIVTMVAKDPEESMALVKDGQDMKMIRLGMEVGGKATVLAIRPKYLVVKVDGKVQVMRLGAEAAGDKKLAAGPMVPRPMAPSVRGDEPEARGAASSNYDAWVKRVSANEYHLDRSMLMEELNDLTKLGMQARVVPNYKAGKYEGFKLIGVRPNSLYRAIGIRSGDVVKAVNGEELNSPNKAIKLFEELKNEARITVELERGGRATQLNYQVK